MCVEIKQFELLEFVFNSVYVELKYRFLSLLLLGLCGGCSHVVVQSVCEVASVPYVVGALVVVTVCSCLCWMLVCWCGERGKFR